MSEETKITPTKIDKNWSDWVLSHLDESEKKDDHPLTDGLMRLVYLLIGDIISSESTVVQAPSIENGGVAVVEHRLVISTHGDNTKLLSFTASADASHRNTDAPYASYPTAIAETRALGRALRRVLSIKTATAEELSKEADNQKEEGGFDHSENYIKDVQIKTLDTLGKRLGINVQKFVNSGAKEYNSISEVKHATAVEMIKQLNVYQGDKTKIPEDLKGYVGDWRTNF